MVKIDMDSIKRLSVAERVRLVQDIWDTLQPTADELPLTDEQRETIDRPSRSIVAIHRQPFPGKR